MSKWVMTERKVIMVEKKREQHGGIITVDKEPRVYNVGDEAPAGHERRPYTKEIVEAAKPAAAKPVVVDERVAAPAPNRMQKPGHKRAKR